ncbi:MAG: hypothetical protein M3O31_04375, partial [Acidobacteriota bacterium]|nr:hypothetical protein [Acidobacteriota bacterium]
MGLSNIHLDERYDLVAALTQAAINETLGTLVHSLQQTLGLYFNVDASGHWIKAPDAGHANFIFTGTLDYAFDANGNLINIVDLNSPAGPQTVIYNLIFKNATFRAKKDGVTIVQGPTDPPWMISFNVRLVWTAATQHMPAAMRAAIVAAGDTPGSGLSSQYLYLDLNNAKYQSLTGITIPGDPSFVITNLTGMMKAHLAEQQAAGGIVLGYSVVAAASTQVPPTFPVTALDFVVSPFLDAHGKATNPALDTLCYLMMVNNAALPTATPAAFPFNFVDDATEQGAMAVRRGLHLRRTLARLSPLLPLLSPTMLTQAGASKAALEFQVIPGTAGSFPAPPPPGPTIATYAYTAIESKTNNSFFMGWITDWLDFNSTLAVQYSG